MSETFIDFLQNITDLGVHTLRQGDKSFLDESAFVDFLETGKVELLKDSEGVRFLTSSAEGKVFVLGPFLLDDDPIPPANDGVMSSMAVPVRSMDKISSYAQLIKLIQENGSSVWEGSFDESIVHNPVFEESYRPNMEEIAFRYEWEKKLRQYISSGDREGILSMFRNIIKDKNFIKREQGNPVRAYKNMAVVANSLGRLSAEKGGLPPFLLHNLSESISIRIEEQSTLEATRRLSLEIPLQYCDAVRNYGLKNHSALIMKACQYILEHIYGKISLEAIAEFAEINPSYLSRRFKEETGETVSAYIRKMRIREAKWLLTHTTDSITDIALFLGFEDVNYFSRVFRKETETSPREYRLHSGQKDFLGIPE